VVLNGHGDFEAGVAGEIEAEFGGMPVLNLVGRLPFLLMTAVAQACTVAVGNDTGPLHLAALAGTSTLGFFGVTDAYKAGYRMPWFRDVKVTCPQRGCWNYHCPVDCLADISPEQALLAFREFLASGAAGEQIQNINTQIE
jgi:ADP-heptose:LPS heptosyltransferase